MVQRLLSLSLNFILFFLMITAHIGVAVLVPYPFSKINVLFLVILLLLVLVESGGLIWVAFFSHVVVELYSLTPFGIILIPATLSILGTYWLYRYVFTTRTFISVLSLSAFSLFVFRLLYVALLGVVYGILPELFVQWDALLITILWEFGLTLVLMSFCYVLILPFLSVLRGRLAR
jgi:hypothetical protein